jgi:predicted transcriptional regulator of viral defense system
MHYQVYIVIKNVNFPYLMKLNELYQITKLYFGYEELARVLGISLASARVAASRYVRQGLLLRVRKNLYVLRKRWEQAGLEEKFQIANMGQVPSYISLLTALEYYGLTTQMQREFFESVSLQRSKEITVDTSLFKYTKVARNLYFGFQRHKGFFIASPEKALLDTLYLMSLGRYALDVSSLEASRLDRDRLAAISEHFPLPTQRLLRSYEYLAEA